MSTATKSKPAPRPPEPQPDHGRVWLEAFLKFKRAVERPDQLLSVPPQGVSLPDLLAVRQLMEPLCLEAGNLIVSALRAAVPAFPTTEAFARIKSTFAIAEQIAADYKRDQLEDAATELLIAVDQQISQRLSDPTASRSVVFPTSDFPKDALRSIWLDSLSPNGAWFWTAKIDCLPPDHPLKAMDPVFYYQLEDKTPAVLLGRAQPGTLGGVGQFSSPGLPRPFNFVSDSLAWTKIACSFQVRKRMESRLDPDAYSAAYSALEKLENPKIPKPWQPPTPSPEPEWGTWSERTTYALDALLHSTSHLKPPPVGSSLDDLLAARAAFQVDDGHDRPVSAAAIAWAGRLTGDGRRDLLYEILPGIHSSIDFAITRELEASWLWASAQRPR